MAISPLYDSTASCWHLFDSTYYKILWCTVCMSAPSTESFLRTVKYFIHLKYLASITYYACNKCWANDDGWVNGCSKDWKCMMWQSRFSGCDRRTEEGSLLPHWGRTWMLAWEHWAKGDWAALVRVEVTLEIYFRKIYLVVMYTCGGWAQRQETS